MYKDFIKALNKKYHCTSQADLSGMDLQHYQFAASTNGRALDAIGVFEAYGFQMSGLRILDVGCAYGGFCIETARKGAQCYGVEISPPLYEFACLNNQGETYEKGSANFVLGDVTSPDFLKKVPLNYFDLIIVNDVFEHVYDTVQLLSNLSKIASKQCTIYFAIPNGNDLRYIAREGHTGHCGLSLLRPLFWHKITDGRPLNIYYRQYEYYAALFAYFGFSSIVPTNYPGYALALETKKRIDEEAEKTRKTIEENHENFPEDYSRELQSRLCLFNSQLEYDLSNLEASELIWKYLTKFWCGFAQRQPLEYSRPTKTTARSFSSDQCENIQFVFSLEGNICSVDVSCDFSIEDYEFAFHLMRRAESIERSHYQKNPHYEWKLGSQGMYNAAIYIKHKDHEHKDYRMITQPLYFGGE